MDKQIILKFKKSLLIIILTDKDGHNKRQKWQGSKRIRKERRSGNITLKSYTKKDLNDADNPDGVVTHLEPDILECESQVGLRKH